MPKLSIIVPVYNVEKYLDRCVTSILNQDFSDWEMILVDDGSTDNSAKMCDEYAAKDSRIVVLHKSNEGVSCARNAGFEYACGEYITVVDSDDWVEPSMYQLMLQKVTEYKLDVVMCDCVKEFQDHSELYTHPIRGGLYNKTQLEKEYYPHLLMTENVEYPATISNYVMVWKRTIMTDNSIAYIPGVRFSEDLIFGAQIMYCAKTFYYLKEEALYHYCIHDSSASHTFAIDKWEDYKKIYSETVRFFNNVKVENIEHQIQLMVLFFLYNYTEDVRNSSLELQEKRQLVRGVLEEKAVQRMFNDIRINDLAISKKQKIKTLMYKYKVGLNILLKK